MCPHFSASTLGIALGTMNWVFISVNRTILNLLPSGFVLILVFASDGPSNTCKGSPAAYFSLEVAYKEHTPGMHRSKFKFW